MIALAMVATAWPVAWFYNTPGLAPGLMILALSPFIMGFIHLDMRRAQRDNDFRSEGVSTIASEVVGLAGTVGAAFLTHSFTAVLWGLIARSLVMVACSHLMATRRYALAWSREHAPRLARFSAPLMLTGLILFLGGQGDRVLVGREIGFAELGHYSAVLLLIYYPSAALLKFVHAIYLPLIAATRGDPQRRAQVVDRLGGETLLLSLGMAAGFAVVAPSVVVLLYGRAFAQSAQVIAAIGVLQSSRYLVVWPTTVAMAMARTGVVLANNVLRLAAWPAALAGLALTHNLYGIVAGFIAGELVAFSVALIMLNRSEEKDRLAGFGRFATFIAGSAVILGWSYVLGRPSILGVAGLAAISLALFAWIIQSERGTIIAAVAMAQRHLPARLMAPVRRIEPHR
jgi:O-antigen/teichoic acid export membrane protein